MIFFHFSILVIKKKMFFLDLFCMVIINVNNGMLCSTRYIEEQLSDFDLSNQKL